MIPVTNPNRQLAKVGRITGKKNIDVFWDPNNGRLLLDVDGAWFSAKRRYVTETLRDCFGADVHIRKIALSSGYLRSADTQSYYDIYDCEWADLASTNMLVHLVI
jgi:hypothetical protein